MIHNEDSRVKIPAILHLMRLGYEYLSLKTAKWDQSTNIFTDIFKSSIQSLNPDLKENDITRLINEISIELENEDIGQAFYERLNNQSGVKLVDFENINNNSFHVVTELPYQKDDESFRPDITLLINGIPLAFIEVKKPNNRDGIKAEYDRMNNRRLTNRKLRKLINITQLMVFSNNMEYDDSSNIQLQGAFYCTTSYSKVVFNYFREEEEFNLEAILSAISQEEETHVLRDLNKISLSAQEEFQINKKAIRPTNRICTSLFKKDRFLFLLQYGLAYVKTSSGLQKHVMRYPQVFATKAIAASIDKGIRSGIIWHTQGSGKTALAYFNVKHLTDYFQSKGIVPKFYFIVDRLDLLEQASREFRARGLYVHHIESKDDFAKDIKSVKAIHNDSGNAEITVVNIQKFQNEAQVVASSDYNLQIQRIYFMDEVHRSYNPKGSFLANLKESDTDAIRIGLTGTPLLGKDFNSRSLFGDYIHKYYYNQSISDGYTLRLIREEIETSYKLKLKKALEEIEILEGAANKKVVYSHPKFVQPMLEYIIDDFEQSRLALNDNTIGAMVICDTADQAKQMYEIFQSNQKYSNTLNQAADAQIDYATRISTERKVKKVGLILHDAGTKEERKQIIEDFKDGKYDMLFVFQMLLTGFDAPRLKKLYLGRLIKAHNLLQSLTRVNRTYKSFKYGYVVDFAGIESQFKKTSEDYFRELQPELGEELQSFSDLFLTDAEVDTQVDEIKNALFHYDTQNAEVFSQQISSVSDRDQMLVIVRALNKSKDLYNMIRTTARYELIDKLDFSKLKTLSREANDHLALINTREALENDLDNTNLLNEALEDVVFTFTKVSEDEMILADQLKDSIRKTREMLANNFDRKDPHLISLVEELERLFKKKKIAEVGIADMNENMQDLESIYSRAKEIERKNQLLAAKYENDEKYARLHKRLMEKDPLTDNELKLYNALSSLKKVLDDEVLSNSHQMNNEAYIEKMMLKIIYNELHNEHSFDIGLEQTKSINQLLVKEYLNEYKGETA